MEHLWSRADANPRRCLQRQVPRKPYGYLRSASVSCIPLPGTRDGKEGVDGSSPSEGSAKVQHVAAFAFSPTCRVGSVRWVWSRLWSFRVQNGLAGASTKRAVKHGRERAALLRPPWVAEALLSAGGAVRPVGGEVVAFELAAPAVIEP